MCFAMGSYGFTCMLSGTPMDLQGFDSICMRMQFARDHYGCALDVNALCYMGVSGNLVAREW